MFLFVTGFFISRLDCVRVDAVMIVQVMEDQARVGHVFKMLTGGLLSEFDAHLYSFTGAFSAMVRMMIRPGIGSITRSA